MIGRYPITFLSWLTALCFVMGAGCGQPAPTEDDGDSRAPASSEPLQNENDGIEKTQPGTSSPDGAGEPDAAEVALRVADEKDLDELLKQREGKVVLVDFWALWCGPCKDLFPHTVELHKRYEEKGLAVISVNLDDPGQEQRVLDFLVSKKAKFDNLISKYDVGPKSFEAFEIEGGNVPYFKLYDRSGKLHTTLGHTQESIEPADIDQAVEQLLDET